jgi:hypothetical protein
MIIDEWALLAVVFSFSFHLLLLVGIANQWKR